MPGKIGRLPQSVNGRYVLSRLSPLALEQLAERLNALLGNRDLAVSTFEVPSPGLMQSGLDRLQAPIHLGGDPGNLHLVIPASFHIEVPTEDFQHNGELFPSIVDVRDSTVLAGWHHMGDGWIGIHRLVAITRMS